MVRERRSQPTTVNFDGLTDVVTNLAGTLILLVVLLLGLTTEARPRLPAGGPAGEKTARPIEPLLRQIQVVELEIQSVDGQIRLIEQGVGELESRVESLRDEAPAPRPKEDLPDAEEGSLVEQVHGRRRGQRWRTVACGLAQTHVDHAVAAARWASPVTIGVDLASVSRPALLGIALLLGPPSVADAAGAVASPSASRLVGLIEQGIQRSDLAISDMEDRMSGLEDRINELLRQAEAIRPPEEKPSRDPEPKAARELRYRPPIEQLTRQQTLLFCCWEGEIRCVDVGTTGVLNPATLDQGESGDRAGKRDSRFQRVLDAHSPGRWCLVFAVWPDSFEVYRSARAIAWEAGYDVGWHPIESGKLVRVQPGLSLID